MHGYVAFTLTSEDERKVLAAVQGLEHNKVVEYASPLHCTIAYFTMLAGNFSDFFQKVEIFAASLPAFNADISGSNWFFDTKSHMTDELTDCFYATVSAVGLTEAIVDFRRFITEHGYPVNNKYGIIPHMTIAYVERGTARAAEVRASRCVISSIMAVVTTDNGEVVERHFGC